MPRDVGYFQQVLRRELPSLAVQYHVSSLGLFGSYVQNKNRPDSDLDVLVTFSETPSLFRLVELENHLSDLLGVKIDLVMRDALRAHVGREILKEVVAV